MRAANPEQVWINEAAMKRAATLIYNEDPLWTLSDAIGTEAEVTIINGLTGEDRRERRERVVVTATMVELAERLATDLYNTHCQCQL